MSERAVSALACAGCGTAVPPLESAPCPFRCAHAGRDRGYHVVSRALDATRLEWPREASTNPFIRYRRLLHSWHVATSHGLSDGWFVDLVEEVSTAVARIDGRPCTVTPCIPHAALAAALAPCARGEVWVKDDTTQVSGSHKSRHLVGLILYLRIVEQLGLADPATPLAIASCGNAALAAAVVAGAVGRRLDVFVPPWAHPAVAARLRALGATLHVCDRQEGQAGDPCYHAFARAVEAGAVPFCVQGPANGLTIDGGETLGYEMVDATARAGGLDAVVVQVGGGALASACAQAFDEACRLGAAVRRPRLYTVQTAGVHPLKPAYDRLVGRIARSTVGAGSDDIAPASRARMLASPAGAEALREALRYAAAHPAEFMWPWETEPRSLATGILDDETYDWLAVVEGMLRTGGFPLVVSEDELERANAIGRETTGIDVDHTGSAGLAGLMQLHTLDPGVADERVAVLFTGVRR